MITDQDLHLFHEGTHARLYERLGGQPRAIDGVPGVEFTVWAPHAKRVSWIGDSNGWDPWRTPMHPVRPGSALWSVFVPALQRGERYKFHIVSQFDSAFGDKADPFAFSSEPAPSTASLWWPLDYEWNDSKWMGERKELQKLDRPISIYEVHLGSWKRPDGRIPGYREIAHALVDHVQRLGFTHVELMPVMEHPFYGSWGYQQTGFFSPTRRYGSPQDLMYLVDVMHQAGIGVIFDYVAGHFPIDGHGLAYFDGRHLYEHADPRQGFHPEWKSLIFNYGRPEVRSFLMSAARFWIDRYHADGLRIDGVASMLYLDYARNPGEWVPNAKGGRENLDAVLFLEKMNTMIHQDFPEVLTIAEDSTAWPKVTRPAADGGLGFDLKWDMGWMHDTLKYMRMDPIHRPMNHDKLTFRSVYQYDEAYCMPLSHDEVVHGKGSILDKMNGTDRLRKFAHARLLYANHWCSPGKKLLFMGDEFGQVREWSHDRELDWDLRADPLHGGLERLVGDLARLYRSDPALHSGDCDPKGFEWIDGSDSDRSVIAFLRKSPSGGRPLLIVMHATPVVRPDYWVGAPEAGRWTLVLSTDASIYGGSGVGADADTDPHPVHNREHRLRLTLPPVGALIFRAPEPGAKPRRKRK